MIAIVFSLLQPTVTIPPDAKPVVVNPISEVRNASAGGGYEERARQVIADQATWAAAWTLLHKNRMPVPPPPSINFDSSVVILAAMGARKTGGFRIEVEGVLRGADRLYVKVTETSPGDTCMTAAAVATPVVAVRIPKSALPVTFVERATVANCS